MFRDARQDWPEPNDPPPKPRVSRREEDVLLWLIGIALLLMLFGPFAGVTVVDLIEAVMRR